MDHLELLQLVLKESVRLVLKKNAKYFQLLTRANLMLFLLSIMIVNGISLDFVQLVRQ